MCFVRFILNPDSRLRSGEGASDEEVMGSTHFFRDGGTSIKGGDGAYAEVGHSPYHVTTRTHLEEKLDRVRPRINGQVTILLDGLTIFVSMPRDLK